jgi:hypothetical protein
VWNVWRGGWLWTVQAGKRVHDAVHDWMLSIWWYRAHYRGLLDAAIADLEAMDPPAGGYAADELREARYWIECVDEARARGQVCILEQMARGVGWVTSD